MHAFIVYPTYTTIDDQVYVQLFGRLENNESFVSISKFNPYFFIAEADLKKAKKILDKDKVKPIKTELTTFQKNPVAKIEFSTQGALQRGLV